MALWFVFLIKTLIISSIIFHSQHCWTQVGWKKNFYAKWFYFLPEKHIFFKCLTLHISKTKLILWLKWNKRLLDNKSWEPLDTILSCKWGIQVFDAGILVWVLKLYAQINEKQLRKISLIQILEDKIFIAFVSKHSKKFNFTMSLFFLEKAIKTVFMLYLNQFLLSILNWVFCAFYILLLILMFCNHF